MSTGGQDNTQEMLDFDLMLESAYIHSQFTYFLRNKRPDLIPYLTIIRKAKLLRVK